MLIQTLHKEGWGGEGRSKKCSQIDSFLFHDAAADDEYLFMSCTTYLRPLGGIDVLAALPRKNRIRSCLQRPAVCHPLPPTRVVRPFIVRSNGVIGLCLTAAFVRSIPQVWSLIFVVRALESGSILDGRSYRRFGGSGRIVLGQSIVQWSGIWRVVPRHPHSIMPSAVAKCTYVDIFSHY